MKVKEIRELWEGLRAIRERDLEITACFRLSRIVLSIKPTIEAFEDSRKLLVRKLASEDNPTVVSPENMGTFETELEKLLDQEVSINLQRIRIQDLGVDKLSLAEMSQLGAVLEG